MPVPLTLKVFKGDTLVASKDFERDIIKIGRLASAHLCLDDEKVSRIHSVIEVAADGSLSIIDMGSVEGTYVNGKRVNKGQLSFGDEIKVGGTLLRLENPAEFAAANLATAAASAPSAQAPAPEAPLAASLSQAAVSPAPAAALPVAVAVAAAPVAVAPAPAPVAAPLPAPVAVAPAPVVAAQPVAEPGPRPRRVVRKSKGPMGLGVHFLWGDQRVGEFFLAPGKKQSLTVGSAKGVDFIMGDSKLGAPSFQVARSDGESFSVCFTGKMKGELTRKGETLDLKAVIESGKASHEGEAYVLTLQKEDLISVDLGGVTLEACYEPVPKRAVASLEQSLDFGVINIFLAMFALAALFVISAVNHAAAGDVYADELAGTDSRIAKLIVKAPETQKNKFLEKLNQQKEKQKAEKAAKKKSTEPQPKQTKQASRAPAAKSDKKAAARNMAQKIFSGKGGAASLFGGGGLGGDLKSAMGNMVGSTGTGGLGGLGLRGGGGGGGGGEVVGIGSVGTKGRGGGMGGYGSGVGGLGGKASVEVGISADEATVSGSLDKELIRQVIQRNRGQIRYCYESLLNRFPKLGGKVAIRFTISAEGSVVTSTVAQTTAGNPELERCVAGRVRTWTFPKPKGGGSVIVTYPFIFKAAGG